MVDAMSLLHPTRAMHGGRATHGFALGLLLVVGCQTGGGPNLPKAVTASAHGHEFAPSSHKPIMLTSGTKPGGQNGTLTAATAIALTPPRPADPSVAPAALNEQVTTAELEESAMVSSSEPKFQTGKSKLRSSRTAPANFDQLVCEERKQKGLVIVLPGIEGRSAWNESVVTALDEAGYQGALEIVDWTTGSVKRWYRHLVLEERNREQAQQIADKIVAYQRDFPDRPVYLIGHSGGGGIAVLVLESLPADTQIRGAILLAAAVSTTHDMRVALTHTERGIWNYHSGYDLFFMAALTRAVGNIDRVRGRAAGGFGFREPQNAASETRALYQSKLHERPYESRMARLGHWGSHFGWVASGFVQSELFPIVATD